MASDPFSRITRNTPGVSTCRKEFDSQTIIAFSGIISSRDETPSARCSFKTRNQ